MKPKDVRQRNRAALLAYVANIDKVLDIADSNCRNARHAAGTLAWTSSDEERDEVIRRLHKLEQAIEEALSQVRGPVFEAVDEVL